MISDDPERLQAEIDAAEIDAALTRDELYAVEGYAKDMRSNGQYSETFLAKISDDVQNVRVKWELAERAVALARERLRRFEELQAEREQHDPPVHRQFDTTDDTDGAAVLQLPVEPLPVPSLQCEQCGKVYRGDEPPHACET